MATTAVTLNGTTYFVPQPGEQGPTYDQDLTNYLVALATAFPQGGASPSSTFQALVSAGANPATAGRIRLAAADLVEWRNQANTGNDVLSFDVNDNLTYTSGATTPVFWSGLAQQITGQPLLNAYRSSNQTGITTSTNVIFDTIVTDTDVAYNNTTGVYTVPAGKGGQYLISTTLLVLQNTSTGTVSANISAGGTNVAGLGAGSLIATATDAMSACVVVQLAAGATISVNANTTGGTLTIQNFQRDTQLSIKRLV